MNLYRVQIGQMVREYATVTIQAPSEQDAIHQAYDIEWDELVNEDKVTLDYECTESLQPIVVSETIACPSHAFSADPM